MLIFNKKKAFVHDFCRLDDHKKNDKILLLGESQFVCNKAYFFHKYIFQRFIL